jgi:membrane protein YqaA with SNARE-associated domain
LNGKWLSYSRFGGFCQPNRKNAGPTVVVVRRLLHAREVRGLSRFALGIFLSAGGVFVLAALDATVFFMLPFGVDAVVIILSVRHPDSRWIYPVLATAGSLAGTAITFWMGRKLGEVGLEKYVSKRRLDRTKVAVQKRGAVTAVFGLVPPPFPFTAFVLAGGALGVDAARFLGVLGAVRLLRFGAETLIAARYGTSALRWLNSDVLQQIVVGVMAMAIVGSAISVYALLRRPRRALGR